MIKSLELLIAESFLGGRFEEPEAADICEAFGLY
jgi:hypothetical protein